MKKVFLLALFTALLFTGIRTSAQVGTSMQFNQIIIKTWDGTSPTYTVPAGKIWKIEGAIGSSAVIIREVNGVLVFGTINSASSNYGENLPMWFPENTTLEFQELGNSSTVSIIEFTVIP